MTTASHVAGISAPTRSGSTTPVVLAQELPPTSERHASATRTHRAVPRPDTRAGTARWPCFALRIRAEASPKQRRRRRSRPYLVRCAPDRGRVSRHEIHRLPGGSAPLLLPFPSTARRAAGSRLSCCTRRQSCQAACLWSGRRRRPRPDPQWLTVHAPARSQPNGPTRGGSFAVPFANVVPIRVGLMEGETVYFDSPRCANTLTSPRGGAEQRLADEPPRSRRRFRAAAVLLCRGSWTSRQAVPAILLDNRDPRRARRRGRE
jgi:hypothetical protein